MLGPDLWTLVPPPLPRPSDSAYRGRFNEHCPEDLVCPQPPSPAGDRGAFARGDPRPARPRRRIRRAQPPDREKALFAARPHPDQPVLRGLDADPVLVRAGGQAARTRTGSDVMNMAVGNSSVKKGETLIDTAMTLNAMHPDI